LLDAIMSENEDKREKGGKVLKAYARLISVNKAAKMT